ncbi:hypothetical protein JW926_01015 [Candidatus Sumerlaeota bacterium]|nr:hypothetical protein [Candidatus Sumerlaeota bacterium]
MEKDQYLNISRPGKACLLCGKSLVEIKKHPSILSNEDASRKDFCKDCWERYKDKSYFSYWITKRLAPDPRQPLSRKERNDLLLRMFESLYRVADETNTYMLFYLAHLLMRYKVFNWKGSEVESEGGENGTIEKSFLVFENKNTGEEVRILDQTLDGEKVSSSQKQIEEYLNQNLPEEKPEEESRQQ